MRTPAKVLRDLPLLWKILVPFMVLLLLVGWAGTFIIVRNLSSRAAFARDQALSRQMLDVRASVQARELYLLESANLAANLRGMAEAVRGRDGSAAANLMRSVLALKRDLRAVAAFDALGRPIAGFTARGDAQPRAARPDSWKPAAAILPRSEAEAGAGIASIGGASMILIAAPVCSGLDRCEQVGFVLAGIDAARLAQDALAGFPSKDADATGIGFYDRHGGVVASTGLATPPRLDTGTPAALHRLRRDAADGGTVTLAAPVEMQGARIGFVAVTVPERAAFEAVRGTGYRLALILLVAMFGVVALAAMVSRFILAQVRPLVLTNRALEQGDRAARAPVLGTDELGELARGINRMAESLQESHEMLESKVDERTQEIERLLQERSDFFASLSHELRTPLAVILVKTDLLLETAAGSTDGKVRDLSTTIRFSADQVLSVINEILELAKAEAGHVDALIEDVAVDRVFDELRGTIDGLVQAAGLTASIRIPRDLAPVRADGAHLRKIILNLVDNAAKYTPSGGRIIIRAATKANTVAISVSDSGVGIPTHARDRVFDPFYRVEGTESQRGQASTGLGLALAKRLVDAQGGTIAVTSRPGRGSTFTVTLRRAARPHVSRSA